MCGKASRKGHGEDDTFDDTQASTRARVTSRRDAEKDRWTTTPRKIAGPLPETPPNCHEFGYAQLQ